MVISASHNPFQDNGVKIFAPSGKKLEDATERLIEDDLLAPGSGDQDSGESSLPDYESDAAALRKRYLDFLAGK